MLEHVGAIRTKMPLQKVEIITNSPGDSVKPHALWAWVKILKTCLNLLQFWGKKSFSKLFLHTNIRKIGALLMMPKILDPIFLTIQKNSNQKLTYVARKWLICLKNSPKVLGNNGHWDPLLTGTPYFRCLETAAEPKRLVLGPKFFRLRNHHTW